MKTRPRPRTKAKDIPAPAKAQFEGSRKFASVPKAELDRRDAEYRKARKKR